MTTAKEYGTKVANAYFKNTGAAVTVESLRAMLTDAYANGVTMALGPIILGCTIVKDVAASMGENNPKAPIDAVLRLVTKTEESALK